MDFALSRSSKSFWSEHDRFQEWSQGSEAERSGLFDLNKYHTKAF